MAKDLTYPEVAKEVEDIQGRIRRLAHHAPNDPEVQTRFSTANKRLETARRYSAERVVPSDDAVSERKATQVPVAEAPKDRSAVGA